MGDKRILARLSLGPGPERLAGFEEIFEKRVAPLLVKHGLVDGFVPDRGGGEGVFSRVFELSDRSQLRVIYKALVEDADWQELLGKLGEEFGSPRRDGLIQHQFGWYSTPAGEGRRVEAGVGQGHWQTYDVTDGLASGHVNCITQDRRGNLWFGTRGGASCFDGQTWRTYTTRDGLVQDKVSAVFEDRSGNLWFGMERGGVSRFDGRQWTRFTAEESLAEGGISDICEDLSGNLWLTTWQGICRYDGRSWTLFSQKDGLAGGGMKSVFVDAEGNLWCGSYGGMVSRYDGSNWSIFNPTGRLGAGEVTCIKQDRSGDLWFGTWQGVCRYDGRTWTVLAQEDGLITSGISAICEDLSGDLWFGTWQGACRNDGQVWKTFTMEDGLASSHLNDIFQDREGYLWMATVDGVSRYDDPSFALFTRDDGLGENRLEYLHQDRKGNLWIGSSEGGVSRYDGESFTTFTTKDGLAATVWAIGEDREGRMWFGSPTGVSRYDGESFTTFTTADGLGEDQVSTLQSNVLSILRDSGGSMWLGTMLGGISRYGDESFTTFTQEDGLGDGNIQHIAEDRDGNIWCCGGRHVSRFDGRRWEDFTSLVGDAASSVYWILQDRGGDLWFATEGEGVYRYDGKDVTHYTTDDGLVQNSIWSMCEDRQGHIWFGTNGGGASRFDGQVFQTLSRRDGLAGNRIHQILEDENGDLWFATDNGLTRFRQPEPLPPPVYIRSVGADKRYEEVDAVEVADSVGLVAFEFGGVSLKTRPGAMVYRHRLRGYEEDWKNGYERRVEYQNLPVGEYSFEVVAVDRDLVYSEAPAVVELKVMHDARDEQIDELEERVRERTRELEETHRKLEETQARLIDELEEELQIAHDMQMRLMPAGPPRVEGVEVAGRCIPANHVGGDLFQYFVPSENRLTLAMADVTGHAMEAAIPVVMFSGILQNQMARGDGLEELFGKLNDSLHDILDSRTFVCFSMGEFDIGSGRFRLANAGCPYPYHFRASSGDIVELQVDAYPLGVRARTVYRLEETQLEAGDWLVLCSDGIAEAEDRDGDLFGFERTVEVIGAGCRDGLSAEALIERLLAEVKGFCGGAAQGDDQTIVAMRVR